MQTTAFWSDSLMTEWSPSASSAKFIAGILGHHHPKLQSQYNISRRMQISAKLTRFPTGSMDSQKVAGGETT